MNKCLRFILRLLSAFLLTSPVLAANLLVNGNFDPVSSTYADTDVPPGWTNLGRPESVVPISIFNTPAYPSGSNYFYNFGGFGRGGKAQAGDGIAQTFATIPGRQYRLKFGFNSEFSCQEASGVVNAIRVTVANLSVDLPSPYTPSVICATSEPMVFEANEFKQPWIVKDYTFTATGTSTTLQFAVTSADTTGNNDPFLAGVEVTDISPVLTVNKLLASPGRLNVADQFTVQIKNGNTVVNAITSSTTTGSGTTVNTGTGTTGATTLQPGTTYTLAEVMAPNSVSPLTYYTSAVKCTHDSTSAGVTDLTGIKSLGNITLASGDVVTCNVTNTPLDPAITVTKALGGTGRIRSTDQFTVKVLKGTQVINSTTNSTTTGTGTTVTAGTGTTGSTQVDAGTVYTITEDIVGTGASLAQYDSTLTCTDRAGVQTGLPNNQSFKPSSGFSITPAPGADIVCTLNNTPKPATLTLNKAFGGTGRLHQNDQFTVQILQGTTVVNSTANSTSAGTGTTVTAGTGTTGPTTLTPGTSYTLAEIPGPSNVALPEFYTSAVKCTHDATSAGTTNVSGITSLGNITLATGDVVICTVTNTLVPPRLTIKQVVTDGTPGGPFTFSYSATNGWGLTQLTSPKAVDQILSDKRDLTALNTETVINVTLPVGWTLNPDFMKCGDTNGGYNANRSETFGVPNATTNTMTIAAANIQPASDITCTVSMGYAAPTLNVRKLLGGTGRLNPADQFTLEIRELTGELKNVTTNSTTTGSGTTVTAGTGTTGVTTLTAGKTYTLTEVMAPGSVSPLSRYTSTLSCTNANTGSGVSRVTGFTSLGNITLVAGDVVTCDVTNSPAPPGGITGRVYSDVGRGTGVANDGIFNGAEQPLAGVRLQLSNCAGTVYEQVITNGQGEYSFKAPVVAVGAPLCVNETNLSGYLSTGASLDGTALPSGTAVTVSGTGYTYQRAADQIAFSWNGTGHTGLNFGDVPPSTFVANGNKTAAPGSTATYAHTFTAGTAGTVVFSVSASTATPTLSGWSERIFADPTCSGSLQPGAAQLYPPLGSGLSVTAQQQVCVIVQEFVPATAQVGYKNEATIQAALSLLNAAPALSASYTVADTTLVDNVALNLFKEVRNITQSGSFGANNQAKSGDVLEYRITYTNTTAAALTNLTINDTTPAFTTFLSSALGSTPATLTACTKSTPANPAPAAPVACGTAQTAGGSGAVIWRFTGSLPGSGSGQVLFQVKVD